ncbi:late embryogenesis abundant protein At1g64065-like [Malania oleifera]|uniref:late embryogenesis abundant protein At1g64065-like n=1 Tax=Malania oleifera TaxID=397392 RepID=UPI0025ADD3A2|nr:late embryogenesis abundant protein At1g64065-like [Malania oleifera]
MTTSEQDSAAALRRKRNLKCLAYVVAGVIGQTMIIVVFALVIMRIRTPRVRLSSVSVETLVTNSTASSPSFSMRLTAELSVKNTNFGNFKYESSNVTISYRGTPVGDAIINKAQAWFRSTKKADIAVSLSSDKVGLDGSQLGGDLNSSRISLVAEAKLMGKVHLFFVFKKKKSVEMNCTVDVNTETKNVENLTCK